MSGLVPLPMGDFTDEEADGWKLVETALQRMLCLTHLTIESQTHKK